MAVKLRGKKQSNKTIDEAKDDNAMDLPNAKAKQPTDFGGESKGAMSKHKSGWF